MPLNIKKYFSTTSSERKGMFVLVSLLVLLISFFFVSDYFFDSSPVTITIKELEGAEAIEVKSKSYQNQLKKKELELFQFNPNKIDKGEWEKLGFSSKQAASIINFRKSGFQFKEKSDLKKLFVVDEEKYKQLAPYVIIPKQKIIKEKECYRVLFISSPDPVYEGLEGLGQIYYKKEKLEYKYYSNSYTNWEQANNYLTSIESKGFEGAFITKLSCDFNCYPIRQKEKVEKKIPKRVFIELNSADTTDLKTLKGVGSYYAKNIVKYRNQLGGFYEVNQLLEVYGIEQELILNNKDFLMVDSSLVRKININETTAGELKKHPYIHWRIANSIVLYRANHGKYKSVQNIQNSDLVNDELYRKIVRYLTVE
jgi:competence ComEA-like helix-hairpin-helix protein